MPDWKPEIRQRLAGSKHEPTREAAIVEELAQYLEDCYAELLSSGATEAEAHQRTLAELSGSESLAQELRRSERRGALRATEFGTHRRAENRGGFLQRPNFVRAMFLKQTGISFIAALRPAPGLLPS